jgi:crotonobetainyl-CoA:carnitine CoA-transferase CaiB-like acyl-CoA transferase
LTGEEGVFCTKVLAALGADVIKIEPPGGDLSRRIGPFYHDEPDTEKSLHWFTYNLNKRSITLNIECSTGQDIFKQLVKTADFLVESFRPGYLESLGLSYGDLSKINPKLIYTSITPFGSTGPYSQFKGSNLINSAMSGYMYLCGDEDRPPVQVSTPVVDIQTSLEAAAATLIAFWHRQQSGEGQHVDVSAQQSMTAQLLPPSLLWKSHGKIATRSRAGYVEPQRPQNFGIFECKDGPILCATTISGGRQPLRDWLASEGMAGDLFDRKWDPVFIDGAPVNIEQKRYINDLFQAFAIKFTREELMFQAQKRKIQVSKVSSVRDVIEDPHLKERGYFVEIEHPELGDTILYSGAPFKSDEMSWQYRRRAPFIGEHNGEIYQDELKLSKEEMAALKQGGVI